MKLNGQGFSGLAVIRSTYFLSLYALWAGTPPRDVGAFLLGAVTSATGGSSTEITIFDAALSS
jgi:hypothetical protein